MWLSSLDIRRRAGFALRFAVILAGMSLVACEGAEEVKDPLDYDQLVLLDAENLAEDGIQEAYDSLLAELSRYVAEPAQIQEVLDNEAPSYSVISGETEYPIYGPDLTYEEGRAWGRATYAFFAIVNAQLESTGVRFYAINGANDLGGMFLTEEQVSEARQALPRPSDWPYIPTPEHPYYGQHY